MSAPTFFPPEVRRAIDKVRVSVDESYDTLDEAAVRDLLSELKRWEAAWRRDEARLVVQTPAWDATHPIVEKAEAALKGKR